MSTVTTIPCLTRTANFCVLVWRALAANCHTPVPSRTLFLSLTFPQCNLISHERVPSWRRYVVFSHSRGTDETHTLSLWTLLCPQTQTQRSVLTRVSRTVSSLAMAYFTLNALCKNIRFLSWLFLFFFLFSSLLKGGVADILLPCLSIKIHRLAFGSSEPDLIHSTKLPLSCLPNRNETMGEQK